MSVQDQTTTMPFRRPGEGQAGAVAGAVTIGDLRRLSQDELDEPAAGEDFGQFAEPAVAVVAPVVSDEQKASLRAHMEQQMAARKNQPALQTAEVRVGSAMAVEPDDEDEPVGMLGGADRATPDWMTDDPQRLAELLKSEAEANGVGAALPEIGPADTGMVEGQPKVEEQQKTGGQAEQKAEEQPLYEHGQQQVVVPNERFDDAYAKAIFEDTTEVAGKTEEEVRAEAYQQQMAARSAELRQRLGVVGDEPGSGEAGQSVTQPERLTVDTKGDGDQDQVAVSGLGRFIPFLAKVDRADQVSSLASLVQQERTAQDDFTEGKSQSIQKSAKADEGDVMAVSGEDHPGKNTPGVSSMVGGQG